MGIIRLLLAVSVVSNHMGEIPLTGNQLAGGQASVQCFFILSGFYVALILSERYRSIGTFYWNRFIRIFPSYWAVLLLVCIASYVRWGDTVWGAIAKSGWSAGSQALMIVANAWIFGSDVMMFTYPSADGLAFTANFRATPPALFSKHAIIQAWSLPIELVFYLIAPAIVGSPARLLLLAMGSLICRYVTFQYWGGGDPWNYRFFPSEAVMFCLGALSFHLYRQVQTWPYLKVAGAVLWGTLLIYIVRFDQVRPLVSRGFLLPAGLWQFYLFVALSLPAIFALTRKWSWDRWIGSLSYPVYLVHFLVASLLSGALLHPDRKVYGVIAGSILLSILIEIWVQQPIERRWKRPAVS